MTPTEKIDANLDAVLRASGSALRNYSVQLRIEEMRDAMRKIMSESFTDGANYMAKKLDSCAYVE